MKLYLKILASCIAPLLPSCITSDQVGFVPGREATDNTIKAINLPAPLEDVYEYSHLFLTLDTEKVFDRVNWAYLPDCTGSHRHPIHYAKKDLGIIFGTQHLD